jgi:hypothetical protein
MDSPYTATTATATHLYSAAPPTVCFTVTPTTHRPCGQPLPTLFHYCPILVLLSCAAPLRCKPSPLCGKITLSHPASHPYIPFHTSASLASSPEPFQGHPNWDLSTCKYHRGQSTSLTHPFTAYHVHLPHCSGSGPVQVRMGSPGFGGAPNLELDFGSSSAPTLNLGLDLGPVWEGSGLNLGSALNCGNTKRMHCFL